MNLTKLFEVQRKLDAEIEKKHPTAAGEDRLAKRILALQVELGECANEWRGFKFWSANQEARTKGASYLYKKNSFTDEVRYKNPLLEEYVDCLHFILSIGLALKLEEVIVMPMKSDEKMTYVFSWLMHRTHQLTYFIGESEHDTRIHYGLLFSRFVCLGEMLGFTWEQIEDAYMSKNATNWERQANGY